MTDESQDRSTDTPDNANRAKITTDPPAEHPLVAFSREIENEKGTPKPAVTVTGLFADSDDPEKKRVYFSPQFDYYAEFVMADALYYEAVPALFSPISGYDVTRVTLKQGSAITFTRVRTQSLIADDQFDIDIRLDEDAPGSIPPTGHGFVRERTMNPTGDTYTGATCHTCHTCHGACPRTQ